MLDNDADSDTLSVTAVNGTAVDVVDGIVIAGGYGTLHVGADGAYDYTLDHSKANVLGEDDTDFEVFHYTVTDSLGASDTGTLTIAITGVNDVAVIGGDAEGDVTEDTNVVTPELLLASGDLTIVDPDAGEAQFVEQPSAVIDGNYGAFTLTSGRSLDLSGPQQQRSATRRRSDRDRQL